LFEHGAFTAADTAATAQALTWFALGLPAHVLVKALSPAFFARADTLTPLVAALAGLAVTVVLALVLGRLLGPAGIAAGIAGGAWSSAMVLIGRGSATFGFSVDAAAARRLPRIFAAAMAMGGLLWLTARVALTPNAHGATQAVVLAVLISGAIALYGLLLALFGVIGWSEAVNAARQTRASGLRDRGQRGI
jgi:putative peptidoglycan lipid II flippase